MTPHDYGKLQARFAFGEFRDSCDAAAGFLVLIGTPDELASPAVHELRQRLEAGDRCAMDAAAQDYRTNSQNRGAVLARDEAEMAAAVAARRTTRSTECSYVTFEYPGVVLAHVEVLQHQY